MDSIEAHKEEMNNNNNGGGGGGGEVAWMSVPTFGGWDEKKEYPDYSLDFSKIRETRKQNKRDGLSRISLGSEHDLIIRSNSRQTADPDKDYDVPHHHHHNQSPTGRRKILSFFNCCIKA
ncbi:hypothetical protein QJS04_geneDACA000669 [Acorus gramineus]|uniref:RIN4 pathogenic type III effector avirulence factor Avr cleavage site domain-containing protein n=1 Tax=Acorus gramineus TaxID=55184 RepID=A0AAV9ATT7_ACOGR|nr:hypothetical protein QJS04_geneDACA000669 [Acorus gramineus]